jgi:hypothetical protein
MLECEAGRLRDGGDRDVQEIANWNGERLGLAYAQCGCHPCYMVCASTYEIRTSSASLQTIVMSRDQSENMAAVKKLVVCGGNGFLGSRICKSAVARGWDVTSIRYDHMKLS